jgi:phosphoenolpyruvate synthase/pyruvate phosphate dikinase
MVNTRDFVVPIKSVELDDQEHVGLIAARLGQLAHIDIPIKKGFVVTPHAFYLFLKFHKLDIKINHLLGATNFNHPHSVYQTAVLIRRLINSTALPDDIVHDIHQQYKSMGSFLSSATVSLTYSTSEHIQKYISEAEPQLNFNHISGDAHVIAAVRHAWAALISPRLVFDLQDKLVTEIEKHVALIIQQSPHPQVSGKMFIQKKGITFTALYGPVDPDNTFFDEYHINPKSYEIDSRVERIQKIKLAYSADKKYKNVSAFLLRKPKLDFRDIHYLASIAHSIEVHSFFPQEVDWIKEDGRFFVLRTRNFHPEEPQVEKKVISKIEETILPKNPHLAQGEGLNTTIGVGKIHIIKNDRDIQKIRFGDVVICPKKLLHNFDELKKTKGIIVEGSVNDPKFKYFVQLTQIPTVMQVASASKILRNGDVVTVHAKKGTIIRGSLMIHNIF